ncbi:hypothetical protein QFC22_006516 [Naganishia vaughanmartiniae]|uniref:Uncharacterized protein n=1 Tax=Naganishia vaughanmartiniae TaxID=1424756 RepID=A0ACC2WIL0_9TREE|nr:hypothetical protein QFC22_006516 [Naganishia vaughanmartiniae]
MSRPVSAQQADPTARGLSAEEMWKNAVQSLLKFGDQLKSDLYHALQEKELAPSHQQEILLNAMGYVPGWLHFPDFLSIVADTVKLRYSLEADYSEGDMVSCVLLRKHHAKFSNVICTIEGSIKPEDRSATAEGSSTLLHYLVTLWRAFEKDFSAWDGHQKGQGSEAADEAERNSLKTLTAAEFNDFWTGFPWPRDSVPRTRASYSGGLSMSQDKDGTAERPGPSAINTQPSLSLTQYQKMLQLLAEELEKKSNPSQMAAITNLLLDPKARSGGWTGDSAYCSRVVSTAPSPFVSRPPSPGETIGDMALDSTVGEMRAGFCNGWPAL